MKAHLLCIPCTLRSAYGIAAKATESEDLQRRVIAETLKWLSAKMEELMSSCPATLHTYVFRLAQIICGNRDPFLHLKRESNRLAMKLASNLKREWNKISGAEAFRLAAIGATCGNAIDFEVEGHYISLEDLESSLLSCIRCGLAIDDTNKLASSLQKTKLILYLLDNAGEIALDKLFIESIADRYRARILAAVKSGPILNDATLEDALEVGLNDVAEVVTTGSSSVGLNLDECTEDFKRLLKKADMIIAKGQGYYETLTDLEGLINKPIAYMLKAKCEAVAKFIGVPRGSNIIKLRDG